MSAGAQSRFLEHIGPDMRVFEPVIRALLACFVFLAGALSAEAQGSRREKTIQSASRSMTAVVLPARDWCASIVSAEIRGTKANFQKNPTEVQRLIGAARFSITDDCPDAEVIRIRGVEKGRTIFLIYTTQERRWSIELVYSEDDILTMLQTNLAQAEVLRRVAYLETLSHMIRVNVLAVQYNLERFDPADTKINWDFDGIEGETFLSFLGRRNTETSAEVAADFARITANRCPGHGLVARETLSPQLHIHSFSCRADQTESHHIIVSVETGFAISHFAMHAQSRARLEQFARVIADRKALY